VRRCGFRLSQYLIHLRETKVRLLQGDAITSAKYCLLEMALSLTPQLLFLTQGAQ
jgi:hypothetical protein